MIQVRCQSWFIFAQTDGGKYSKADVQTDDEIIVKKHSEKYALKADCEIYG